MVTGALFGLVASLYYLATLLLVALTLFIATQGSRRTRAPLRRTFLSLACCLLLWQLTLFLEVRTAPATAQLWIGRLNFTAIVYAPYLTLLFVQEVATKDSIPVARWIAWCGAETLLLTVLTLLTPLVDVAEQVTAGQAITTYGPLFPFYLLHVLGYLVAALVFVARARQQTDKERVRHQLTFIGAGMLVTGSMASITNALLLYAFGDFRFCDLGALSTTSFLLAVAYAAFLHRLFALRVVLRTTLVNGLLLAFVLGAYSSAVFLVSQYLSDNEGASSTGKLRQFAVLLIAFSFDPLRRYLENKTDRLLFQREVRSDKTKRRRQERTNH
ncbi:MAG: hypothetical protein JOZ57_04255 [Abitibacteriaceae bacterium]|nr:hypothetical protein [Abditibacteriaceae bacterium]